MGVPQSPKPIVRTSKNFDRPLVFPNRNRRHSRCTIVVVVVVVIVESTIVVVVVLWHVAAGIDAAVQLYHVTIMAIVAVLAVLPAGVVLAGFEFGRLHNGAEVAVATPAAASSSSTPASAAASSASSATAAATSSTSAAIVVVAAAAAAVVVVIVIVVSSKVRHDGMGTVGIKSNKNRTENRKM